MKRDGSGDQLSSLCAAGVQCMSVLGGGFVHFPSPVPFRVTPCRVRETGRAGIQSSDRMDAHMSASLRGLQGVLSALRQTLKRLRLHALIPSSASEFIFS